MDTVVYEPRIQTETMYVIQFQELDGDWSDSNAPKHISKDTAIAYLDALLTATNPPYAYRIVERTK